MTDEKTGLERAAERVGQSHDDMLWGARNCAEWYDQAILYAIADGIADSLVIIEEEMRKEKAHGALDPEHQS